MENGGSFTGIKSFNRFICFVSFGCAALSVALYYLAGMEEALYVLYLPMEGIGSLIRWLSLSSKGGDILAWGLYIAISMIPMGHLLWKMKSKEREMDVKNPPIGTIDLLLLPVLSIYIFYMLYCFINPATMSNMVFSEIGIASEMMPVLKSMLAGVLYSMIIGYIILSLANNFKSKQIWKRTEQILMICGVAYASFICYVVPFNLFSAFGNKQLVDADKAICLVNFFLELLPLACFIGIIEAGIGLIQVLHNNKYDDRTVEAANLLAERSRRTVIISVVCNIIQNLLQIIFASQITNTNFLLDIPFLPLILAFSGLLIAEHLRESTLLYDDNQMII